MTELLKELHRIVNEAIRTQAPGKDQAEGLTFHLSQIDLEKLRDEFAKNVRRKATALQDIRDIVEQKLAKDVLPITVKAMQKISGEKWTTVKEWEIWWSKHKATFKIDK